MFLKENRWRGAIPGGSRSYAAPEDLPTGKELLVRLQAGDRLFLLSFAEVVRYMYKAELRGDWSEWVNDSSVGGADCGSAVALLLFTKRKSANKEEAEFFAEPVTWWLRTPGGEENWRMAVETDGCPSVEGYSAERGEISVRPAMWLDLGRLSLLNEDGGNQPE